MRKFYCCKLNSYIICIVLSLMLIMTGCNKLEADIEKSEAIASNEKDISQDKVVVSDIKTYENLHGWDWSNDETILSAKLGNMSTEIWLYNLESKKENKQIFTELTSMFFSKLTHDKKYIFYVNASSNNETTACISDLEGNIKVEFKVNADFRFWKISDSINWSNSNELIMSSSDYTGFNMVNTNGTKTEIKNIENEGMISEFSKVEEKIYYIVKDGDCNNLKVYNINTKEKKLVEENVDTLRLSSDKKKLIITKSNNNKEVFIIKDLEVNNKELLLKNDFEIIDHELNPNLNKIAYICIDENKNERFIIRDINAKEELEVLSLKEKQTFDDMVWSPSGKKIMTVIKEENNDKSFYKTKVITFE